MNHPDSLERLQKLNPRSKTEIAGVLEAFDPTALQKTGIVVGRLATALVNPLEIPASGIFDPLLETTLSAEIQEHIMQARSEQPPTPHAIAVMCFFGSKAPELPTR